MFETRAPAARLATIGAACSGEIIEVRRTQHTEYRTNIPYYWQDKKVVTHAVNPATGQPNDPKMQTEITLETGQPDEHGITCRRIFVRGKRMEEALRAAVAAAGAGAQGLLIGGQLTCTLTGTEPSTGGGNDAKLYAFTYTPPEPGTGRRPDPTPILAGSPQNLQPPARPVVATYTPPAVVTTTSAPAGTVTFGDEPPF